MASSNKGPRYGTINMAYAATLATTAPDDDGPVWMVNLMKYREVAEYADGRDSAISGREADNRYAPLGPLAAIGAEAVFFADVERQLGGAEPTWDRVGVVKYPTRRSFIEMQSRPDFVELHAHKEAGMSTTTVMGCLPMDLSESPLNTADWADVPHSSTADDGPIVVLHVIKFAEPDGLDEMAGYHDVAGEVAGPQGARIDGFFTVEGTILGDGRSWDQVHFVGYPSRAAFMAVATDPWRIEAEKNHRQAAIADTYTLVLTPTINKLATSIAAELL